MTEPVHLVSDKLTQLTIEGLLNAWLLNWECLTPQITRAAVELKTAHVKLETGLRYCHCWNIGNRKHRAGDGYNWTRFACGEEVQLMPDGSLPPVLRSPLVTCKGQPYARAGARWQSVWIRPPHPWSEFCAHDTLTEGVRAQLGYLQRHPKVLEALCTGDPNAYNQALIEARYYTATPSTYLQGLIDNLADVHRVANEWDGWGPDVV